MPGTGQQAGSPRREPLSPATAAPPQLGAPGTKMQHLHLSTCPPVFLGPCPGISPRSTGGGSAGRCHLSSEDTGHCPSLPTSPGLWAARPVPALPCSPSCPQRTRWPQTQPSSGRKAEGNQPLAPFGHSPLLGTPLGTAVAGQAPEPQIPPGFTGGSGATAPALLSPDSAAPGCLGCLWVPGPFPLPGTALS